MTCDLQVWKATCTQLQEEDCATPEELAHLQTRYSCSPAAPPVIAAYKDAVPSAETLGEYAGMVAECTSEYLCTMSPGCSHVVETAQCVIPPDV